MNSIITKLLSKEYYTNLSSGIFTFLSIVFLRTFLENFSSPEPSLFFTSPYGIFLNYTLFYFGLFMTIAIILNFFTNLSIKKILSIMLLFFPIICLPPIVDLALTNGAGYCMAYIGQDIQSLIISFLTFIGKLPYLCGITIGIRIEIILILIAIFSIIKNTTRNNSIAIFGTLTAYAGIFFHLSLPSFLFILAANSDSSSILTFFDEIIKESWLKNNFLSQGYNQNSSLLHEKEISILMGSISWLLMVIQFFIIFYLLDKKKYIAWSKNLRWERIVYYISIGTTGLFFALKSNQEIHATNIVNIIFIFIFILLIALSFWLAVAINDIEDTTIDTISNTERPLIRKTLSINDMQIISIALAILIIFGAALLNYQVLILFILFQGTYYIYSCPPLRLKRHFLMSSPLIALNALFIMMSGFFLLSPDQYFLTFPQKTTLLIILFFSLIANVKDIKDFAGDTIGNIKTIPVVFGLKNGKIIIGLLLIIACIIVPIAKRNISLLHISILFGIFSYYLINRKNYKESYLFYLFYLYSIYLLIFFW